MAADGELRACYMSSKQGITEKLKRTPFAAGKYVNMKRVKGFRYKDLSVVRAQQDTVYTML